MGLFKRIVPIEAAARIATCQIEQIVIQNGHGCHAFDYRNRSWKYARVVPSLCFEADRVSLQVNGVLLL